MKLTEHEAVKVSVKVPKSSDEKTPEHPVPALRSEKLIEELDDVIEKFV